MRLLYLVYCKPWPYLYVLYLHLDVHVSLILAAQKGKIPEYYSSLFHKNIFPKLNAILDLKLSNWIWQVSGCFQRNTLKFCKIHLLLSNMQPNANIKRVQKWDSSFRGVQGSEIKPCLYIFCIDMIRWLGVGTIPRLDCHGTLPVKSHKINKLLC